MKRTVSFLLALLVIFSLVSCVVNPDIGDTGNGEKDNEIITEQGTKVGELAYSLDVELLDGSGMVNIENYRGKVVVVNFWGTWCGPCKSELPHFNELAEEYKKDAVFLLIHSTDKSEDPLEYVTENFPGSRMIFAKDEPLGSSDKIYRLMGGIGYYPRTIVIDRKGVITFVGDGALSKEQLKTQLDKAANN